MSPDEYYVGVVLNQATYISDKTGKSVRGYQVHWLLDDIKEYMSYEELVPRVKDYDDWEKEGLTQLEEGIVDSDNDDDEDMLVMDVISKHVDKGSVGDGESVDDLFDDLRDHCRDLMMVGEGDQYHSDDENFVIGGVGDQKILDD